MTMGYATLKVDGRRRRAHRLAYEWFVGPIPEGMVLDHLCRVRHCVNPAHLEPVSDVENRRRGKSAPLETHCNQGHELGSGDVYVDSRGKRVCRPCERVRGARKRAKRRAAL